MAVYAATQPVWYSYRTNIVWSAEGGLVRPAAGSEGLAYDPVTGERVSDLRQTGTTVATLRAASDGGVVFEVNDFSVIDVDFGAGKQRLTSLQAQGAAETASQIAEDAAHQVIGLADSLPTNPLKFGAVGDGVTDDTNALNDAVQATPGGGVVELPGNLVFKVNAPVVLNRPVTLRGGTLLLGAFTQTAVHVTSSDTTVTTKIQGPGIEGERTTSSYGVLATGTETAPLYRVKVLDTTILGIPNIGVYAKYVRDSIFDLNHVEDMLYAGVMLISATDCMVTRNTVKNVVQKGAVVNTYGIAVTDSLNTVAARSRRVLIAGNTVQDVREWEGVDTHGGDQIWTINNTIIGCRHPIAYVVGNEARIAAPTNGIITGNVIIADGVTGSYGGIRLIGSAGNPASAVVTGNTITGYGTTPYDVSNIDAAASRFEGNSPEHAPWTDAVLLNGWGPYTGGGGYATVGLKYRTTATHFEAVGMIKNTSSGATGSVICDLPAEALPAHSVIEPCIGMGGALGLLINVESDALKYYSGTANPSFVAVNIRAPLDN